MSEKSKKENLFNGIADKANNGDKLDDLRKGLPQQEDVENISQGEKQAESLTADISEIADIFFNNEVLENYKNRYPGAQRIFERERDYFEDALEKELKERGLKSGNAKEQIWSILKNQESLKGAFREEVEKWYQNNKKDIHIPIHDDDIEPVTRDEEGSDDGDQENKKQNLGEGSLESADKKTASTRESKAEKNSEQEKNWPSYEDFAEKYHIQKGEIAEYSSSHGEVLLVYDYNPKTGKVLLKFFRDKAVEQAEDGVSVLNLNAETLKEKKPFDANFESFQRMMEEDDFKHIGNIDNPRKTAEEVKKPEEDTESKKFSPNLFREYNMRDEKNSLLIVYRNSEGREMIIYNDWSKDSKNKEKKQFRVRMIGKGNDYLDQKQINEIINKGGFKVVNPEKFDKFNELEREYIEIFSDYINERREELRKEELSKINEGQKLSAKQLNRIEAVLREEVFRELGDLKNEVREELGKEIFSGAEEYILYKQLSENNGQRKRK